MGYCTFCCESECDDGLCLCERCEEIVRDAVFERSRTDLNGLVEDYVSRLDSDDEEAELNQAYAKSRYDMCGLVEEFLWLLDSDDWSEPWLAEVRP